MFMLYFYFLKPGSEFDIPHFAGRLFCESDGLFQVIIAKNQTYLCIQFDLVSR